MEAINRAVKIANHSCTDYNSSFDNLVAVATELKGMTIGYHKSYWGDDRDHGIAPLITKTVEYRISSAGVEDTDIIKALVKSFKEEMGVELFKAKITRPTETYINRKGEITTSRGDDTLTIEASDDPRILELEVLSQLKG
jgi:hypothetical protein